MKTRCPNCGTSFRVTPEQLKIRAGKVRCGQCQSVFNALDSLVDESLHTPGLPASATEIPANPEGLPADPPSNASQESPAAINEDSIDILLEPLPEEGDEAENKPLSVEAAQALGKAQGLILPRETTEIPGYSKWAEGVMTTPISLPDEKLVRWPFILLAAVFSILLIGQMAFHFRSEIVILAPTLRPALESLAEAANADIPLPRHAEHLNIEASELLKDPERSKLLILQATLRNRAGYGQAFPLLELTLTDTQDAAIARRVFQPANYLPEGTRADAIFPARSDIALRLWIDASAIEAAGYRVYVFYP